MDPIKLVYSRFIKIQYRFSKGILFSYSLIQNVTGVSEANSSLRAKCLPAAGLKQSPIRAAKRDCRGRPDSYRDSLAKTPFLCVWDSH